MPVHVFMLKGVYLLFVVSVYAQGVYLLNFNFPLQAVPPVIHRDIKSSNILLDQSMRARVCVLVLYNHFSKSRFLKISHCVKGVYDLLSKYGGNLCILDFTYLFNICIYL